MTPRVLPVGAFVFLFRELLESDPLYADLWLEGEVSDFSRSSAGHFYFNLSDQDGSLKCVLFRRDALRQHQLPQLGTQVAVHKTSLSTPARDLSNSRLISCDLPALAPFGWKLNVFVCNSKPKGSSTRFANGRCHPAHARLAS